MKPHWMISGLAALSFSLSAALSYSTPLVAPAVAMQRASSNKQLVVDFYNQFFNQHDLSAADRYIGDRYIQHNPSVKDGKQAFVDTFADRFKQAPERRSTIIRAIAEDDLVVLHVHSVNDTKDRGRALVDIFRVENNKIVEHWDVIQPVPDASASGNSMF
ncbi:nuclear transport factor 2 family protein [Chromobacterium haemolyticum]|uniref:nuclear transport factor 2 family protein n=1 Tax=Chromobacterium haemolyticum TaxID=394935 RepID=UPI0040564F86